MLKTATIIVERKGDSIYAVFCNDPELAIDSGTVVRGLLPQNALVENVAQGTMNECGSCSAHHRKTFTGDCRDDSERFVDCT